MFLRIIRGSLFRSPQRKLVCGIIVMLGTAVVTSLSGIMLEVGDQFSRELSNFGANFRIVPKQENLAVNLGGVPYYFTIPHQGVDVSRIGNLKKTFWRNNIVAAAPLSRRIVETSRDRIVLTGTWFGKRLLIDQDLTWVTGFDSIHPNLNLVGRWPKDGAAETVVGATIADHYSLSPGDRLTLRGIKGSLIVVVTGILETGESFDKQIFIDLDLFPQLGFEREADIITVKTYTTPDNELARRVLKNAQSLSPEEIERFSCTPFVSTIQKTIQQQFPDARVEPVFRVAETEGKLLGYVKGIFLFLIILSSLAAALGIFSTAMSIVLERQTEIGLNRALGASAGVIIGYLVSELLIAAAGGAVAGSLLGFIGGRFLSSHLFGFIVSINWGMIPLSALVSILIAGLGATYPFWRALRINPSLVLHRRLRGL